MKTVFAVTVFLAAAATEAQAAYTYYYADQVASANSNWTNNGTVTYANGGFTSASAGSLVSTITPPVYAPDYEVYANIFLNASGGNYSFLLRASDNALPPSTGTFYSVELQNPTFSGGACTATLAFSKTVSGVTTTLSSGSIWCSSLVQWRIAIRGTTILVHQRATTASQMPANSTWTPVLWTGDSSITSGKPGLAVRGAPSNNYINWANLGPTDGTPPNAVDLHNLSTSSYATRIDMQWKGASDDSNGTGVAFYQMFRLNGGSWSFLNFIFQALGDFTDSTVAAGHLYTYLLRACDYHANCTDLQFSATTPPTGSIDPRQVGLRPTTTSWGGGGENINILSGNLNFTLPLLTAKARGGLSLGIGLNYNSQNWRQDGSVNWNYGRDVGYGYGVKLGAGSMTLSYGASWNFDHWTFTDSTGAEYRLDRPVYPDGTTAPSQTGIWGSSTDGATFIYNASNNRLTFPNGTFWQFDCASTGNEGDEGTRYPTLIQDTNGNQLILRYKPGVAAVDGSGNNIYVAWPNSSSRIDQIEDVRGVSGVVVGGELISRIMEARTVPAAATTTLTCTPTRSQAK